MTDAFPSGCLVLAKAADLRAAANWQPPGSSRISVSPAIETPLLYPAALISPPLCRFGSPCVGSISAASAKTQMMDSGVPDGIVTLKSVCLKFYPEQAAAPSEGAVMPRF
jgi:hypothetical protein